MSGRLGREGRFAMLAAKLGRRVRGVSSDRGASATEYAVLVSFIVIVIVFAVGYFGTSLRGYYSYITASVGSFL